MRRLFKIFTLCLLAQIGHSQCDTTGILLELQATTNIQGFLFGNDRCLVEGSIIAPLYVSGDSLLIDTTAFGTGTVTSVATTAPAAGFTISGGPITTSGTFIFTLANDLAALEAISGNGIAVRTASETWTTRSIAAGTGISVSNGDGVSGNPTITNTSPDQVVSITGAGINVVTGTYPTFTITGTEVGNGTVTNFSAGDLSPLFTTTEATTTTTPALSFALTNAGANTFFGNNTDAGAAPSYRSATALTKVDDTNVTMTLGGAPNNSLLRAVSLTLGWTGNLSVSRGGIGVGTITGIMQGNGTGAVTGITNSSTAGQVLLVTGASTYAWGALDLANTSAVTGDLPLGNIVPGTARSLLGVSGAAADWAAIQTGGADQVMRTNAGNTAIGWGTVATGGIANQAVTYVKMQNAVANNVFLANNNGAGSSFEEITAAEAQTILGFIDGAGANQRIPYFTDANTVAAEAAFLYNATDDRMTITSALPGLGAGTAILNLTNTGPDPSGEFLQMRGDISSNMLSGMLNTNTGSGAGTMFTIGQTGDGAADPVLQIQVSGAGGNTSAIGIDNSDGNKLKLTPNGATPGANVNASLVGTNGSPPLWGFNIDAPVFTVDIGGKNRSEQYHGINVSWVSEDLSFGLGAGTTPTFTRITGTHNWVRVLFKTGTGPAANDAIFTIIRKTGFEFAAKGFPVFCAGNAATAGEIAKFYVGADNGIQFTIRANGTLTANTDYELIICFSGH